MSVGFWLRSILATGYAVGAQAEGASVTVAAASRGMDTFAKSRIGTLNGNRTKLG